MRFMGKKGQGRRSTTKHALLSDIIDSVDLENTNSNEGKSSRKIFQRDGNVGFERWRDSEMNYQLYAEGGIGFHAEEKKKSSCNYYKVAVFVVFGLLIVTQVIAFQIQHKERVEADKREAQQIQTENIIDDMTSNLKKHQVEKTVQSIFDQTKDQIKWHGQSGEQQAAQAATRAEGAMDTLVEQLKQAKAKVEQRSEMVLDQAILNIKKNEEDKAKAIQNTESSLDNAVLQVKQDEENKAKAIQNTESSIDGVIIEEKKKDAEGKAKSEQATEAVLDEVIQQENGSI